MGLLEHLILLTSLCLSRLMLVQFLQASVIKHSISDLFRNSVSGVKLRYCSSYLYQPSCVTVIPLLFKQKITEGQFACIKMQLKMKIF